MTHDLAYAGIMADKPASRPIAKPITHPSGNGYAGQFALPGLVPDYVRDGNRVVRFDTADVAEFAALRTMKRLLESRMVDPRKAGGYERMSGAALADALQVAKLTPTLFAEIYGVPQSRVIGWIDGIQDIPHSANVLVRLLEHERNFNQARAITEKAQGLRTGLIDDDR